MAVEPGLLINKEDKIQESNKDSYNLRKAISFRDGFFVVYFCCMTITTKALYSIFKEHPSVQTDTRLLAPGDLYFALKGPQFNGNAFAMEALQKGAAFAIVDDAGVAEKSDRCLLVEDSLRALQDLAKYHREQFQVPVLAITGSNGKTTTKELIHAVLSSTFRTYTTRGNLNNHIGIPLTLLRIKPDAEMAIVEMGANHLKEIEAYCLYTQPTHGIITNCGKAHLEGFGSEEGVRKGKGELFDYLRSHHGTVFINHDYGYLREMSKGIPGVFTYGTKNAQLTGIVTRNQPFIGISLATGQEHFSIQTRLVGDYNLPNVLAAVAAGIYFKVSLPQIISSIENYVPSNSRSQLVEKNGNHIILDAYNANPSSMSLAIENFARLKGDSKILVLGAMAELGEESLVEHEKIISLIRSLPWKEVILVGGDFLKLNHPFRKFADSSEAKQWFDTQHFKDAYILVKGSRSMQMEKVVG